MQGITTPQGVNEYFQHTLNTSSPTCHPDDIFHVEQVQILLEVANQVALKYAVNMNWSTWHSWSFFSDLQPDSDEVQMEKYAQLWQEPQPYGNCVDMAESVARDLSQTLANTIDVNWYGTQVCLYACYSQKVLDVKEGEVEDLDPQHCIVVVPLRKEAILVVDPAHHPFAFILPMNASSGLIPGLDMGGHLIHLRYHYSDNLQSNVKSDGRGTLLFGEKHKHDDDYSYSIFMPVSYIDALRRTTFRMARETEKQDSRSSSRFPATKHIVINQLIESPPELIPSILTLRGYFTTTCKVSIDFENNSLAMQIPAADWLHRSDNMEYRESLERLDVPVRANRAVALLVLDGNAEEDLLMDRIELFGEIGSRTGLPMEEFLEILQSLWAVHEGSRSVRQQTFLEERQQGQADKLVVEDIGGMQLDEEHLVDGMESMQL